MKTKSKTRFVPQVDGIEKRLLLTASPAFAPLAVAAAQGIHASSITAQAASQSVVEFKNASSLSVSYQFQWSPSSSWTSKTLAPGANWYYWTTTSSSLAPKITFDQSVLPGWQAKTYSLSYFNYVNGGTPPISAAKVYQFQNVPGGTDLYSITTQAVTSFKNSSSLTASFQFRWNTSASWSSTVNLAPGSTYYFWSSPPNASSPQVQFDQSVLPGWQTKTYSLSWNLYTGSGTPPFSSGKLYTFRNVPGGVDLNS